MLIHQDNLKMGFEPVGSGVVVVRGGALPLLRIVGSVPGRRRVGPHSQNS